MLDKVEFKVNPVGEIKKMRETMYSDRYSWIEETIQNAMRAKAEELHFSINPADDEIIIEDDGIGCKEPQLIFEKSTSGWDEEVLKETNPFGEGFFTLVMLGDDIHIRSYDWEVHFRPGEIIRNKTMEGNLTVTRNLPFHSGFRITITNLQEDYNAHYKVIPRIIDVAKFIQTVNIYINGDYIEKTKFTDTDGSYFAYKIDNKDITGWIRPFRWGSEYDGHNDYVHAYFENRPVSTIGFLHGVSGIIHINRDLVDLRSPDRREFIHNERYRDFRDIVRKEVKQVMMNLVINGGDEDISKYEDIITNYLSEEEYKHHLKFVVHHESYDELDEILERLKQDSNMKLEALMGKTEFNPDDSTEEDYSSPTLPPAVDVNRHDRFSGNKNQEEFTKKEKFGMDYKDLEFYPSYFYIDIRELIMYQDKVKLAQYYNVPVVVTKNSLETKVIEKDEKASHIIYLEEEVRVCANLKNVGYEDEREVRALWLFNIVGKGLHVNGNIFRICDLETFREKRVLNHSEVEAVNAEAVVKGGVIYFDRAKLNKQFLKDDPVSKITADDIKFILSHLDTMAHELAHAIYSTVDNTEEHFKIQLEIQKDIINLLV